MKKNYFRARPVQWTQPVNPCWLRFCRSLKFPPVDALPSICWSLPSSSSRLSHPLPDYFTMVQIILPPPPPHPPIGYHSIGWINSLNQSRLFHPVQNISTQSKFLHSIQIILPHTYYFIHFLTQVRLLYSIQPSNFVLSFPKTSMFWVLSIKVPSQGKVRSGKDWIKTTFLNKSEYL